MVMFIFNIWLACLNSVNLKFELCIVVKYNYLWSSQNARISFFLCSFSIEIFNVYQEINADYFNILNEKGRKRWHCCIKSIQTHRTLNQRSKVNSYMISLLNILFTIHRDIMNNERRITHHVSQVGTWSFCMVVYAVWK